MSASRQKIIDGRVSVGPGAQSLTPMASAIPARRDDAKVFLREFTRELIREVSLTTKILTLFCVVVFAGGLVFAGHVAFQRYQALQLGNVSQAETLTNRLNKQEQGLAHLSERLDQTTRQITSGDKKGSELKQTNPALLFGPSLPTALWKSYSNGACLIAGSYRLIDRATGLPLRYPDAGMNPAELLLTSGTEVPLTAEGDGVIFELEFLGTGFYVGGGYVLTNRHVASQPWGVDRRAQFLISSTGASPRLETLQAFFPGQPHPFALKLRRASMSEDVAVCTLKTAPPGIPALPLDHRLEATEVGKAVVMMGYPTGPNRMLALLSEAEAMAVENKYGGTLVTLLDQLAKRRLIKPLTTQGHITDLYKNRIVFDAATTEGSSGTPMLGESGKVIGITFGVLVDERASNFALPIAVGIEELKKAGWKPPRND